MNNEWADTLFAYDAWANRRLLEVCCQLTPEQWQRPLGLGHGSLESTLRHLVGALIFFTGRLNRIPGLPRPDRENRLIGPEELLGIFEHAVPDFLDAVRRAASDHSPADLLNWTDSDAGLIDPSDRVPYATALTQMIDHSIHHRTQGMDMLDLLGLEGPKDWHPFEWDEIQRGLK